MQMIRYKKTASNNNRIYSAEDEVSIAPAREQRGALRSKANAIQSTFLETSAGTLQLRSFCPPSLIESLHADDGLRAFARLPEREHALLLNLAQRADSSLTIAYTSTGEIVGQATLAPADDAWKGSHQY